MNSMNINLYYQTKLENRSLNDINKLYCVFDNNNDYTNEDTSRNIMNLYANTSYNFLFDSNTINSNVNLSTYYISFFYHFNYYVNSNLKENFSFIEGINNITIDDNFFVNSSVLFKLNDINFNYTYTVFKLNTNNIYEKLISGPVKINFPLHFIKLIIHNDNLLHDPSDTYYETTKDLITIDNNQLLDSNKLEITLFENNNYIFEFIYNSSNLLFNIFMNNINNYNKITKTNLNVTSRFSKLIFNNIPNNIPNNISNISNNISRKYIWSVNQNTNLLYTGNLNFINLNKNVSNEEKLNDFKYKNVQINYRLLYNKFTYNEHLNIKNINNTINYLSIYDSHKFLMINNTNQNISIVLPSNNIYLGLTYNILLNKNLNTLTIYCEDSSENLANYDKIKGSLFLINSNNLYCKCVSSNIETLETNNVETNLSENIIIKKIRLNNGNVYNGGLNTYGLLKLICSEQINNKYIWNLEGKLIGQSILYANSYLYNPFI